MYNVHYLMYNFLTSVFSCRQGLELQPMVVAWGSIYGKSWYWYLRKGYTRVFVNKCRKLELILQTGRFSYFVPFICCPFKIKNVISFRINCKGKTEHHNFACIACEKLLYCLKKVSKMRWTNSQNPWPFQTGGQTGFRIFEQSFHCSCEFCLLYIF